MSKYQDRWSVSAVILGVLVTLIEIVAMFSTPTFTIIGHQIVIDEGIVVVALLMESFFWAIVEILTPIGTKLLDLVIRALLGFILGMFFGGLFAYIFHFGQYVLVPASQGNLGAIAFLIAVLFAFIVFLWDAVWSHTHTYTVSAGD